MISSVRGESLHKQQILMYIDQVEVSKSSHYLYLTTKMYTVSSSIGTAHKYRNKAGMVRHCAFLRSKSTSSHFH